ncbi:hydrolase [Massilia sp. Root418]|jgi:pimeloyl-ACP methyl ester carboxylesterase|uniref:alpha/beta fold hydrolase n=1 Tax=Massilia sp. Root418 TaxID=1736532 RepID=UPI0006F3CA35|nr:alpha/beta hydrolase [Massilia sp. Root418]KQW96769.1 hydrolase [Massilia sp. Root418]
MSWVFLRGLMRESRHWGAFPDQFRAVLPEADIVTPDLPGNGINFRQRSPLSVQGMVEACRADLRARGRHGPYDLLALSLGAMVAVQWQASYPQEVARCVLLNTSMRPFSRFYQRLRWQNYPAILRQLVLGGARRQEQLALRLTSVTHGGDTRDSELLKRWVDYHNEFPVSRMNAVRQLAAAARFRAPARQPDGAPLLVLAGARDGLVDPLCSQRLAQAWDADFRLHPEAGHDLPLDDGPWVAQQVAQWLAGYALPR